MNITRARWANRNTVVANADRLRSDDDQVHGSYQTKPIYVFGSFGMFAFAISLLAGLYAVFLKIFTRPTLCRRLTDARDRDVCRRRTVLLMGLLAEMLVRTYHESQQKRFTPCANGSDSRTVNPETTCANHTGWANLDSTRRLLTARGICCTRCVNDGPSRPDSKDFCNDRRGARHATLAIIDLVTGEQPAFNEDKSIRRDSQRRDLQLSRTAHELEKRGHAFRSASDTEVLPHLYEEYGDDMIRSSTACLRLRCGTANAAAC